MLSMNQEHLNLFQSFIFFRTSSKNLKSKEIQESNTEQRICSLAIFYESVWVVLVSYGELFKYFKLFSENGFF